MIYQLGWATEPGLRRLSVSEFRATRIPPGEASDNDGGVAIELASHAERDEFLRHREEHFAARRFMNAAEAFDTVKAYVLERAVKR